jgi:MFS family permease
MDETSESASRPLIDEMTGSLGHLASPGGLGPGFEGGGTVEPTVPLPGEHPAGVAESARVGVGRALVYSSGNFGSGLYWALNSFILPILLIRLGVQPVLNNLLSSTRSVEGAVIQPLVGARSDNSWKGYLGRRRYFIVRWLPICVLFVALTPFAAGAGGLGQLVGLDSNTAAVILVTITIVLFTLTFNIMYDPYNALLADITPEAQRGRVNGIFQATSGTGQVVILVAAVVLSFMFKDLPVAPVCIAVAAALLIFFAITVVGIREPRALPGVITHHRYTLRDYWRGLRRDFQVQLYFLNQFLLWFGISAVQFNLIYYAKEQLHLDDTGSLILAAILLLSTALFVWPLGVLSDRIGLKQVFVLGVVLMSGAAIGGTLTSDPVFIGVLLGIAGIGNAAQTASSYPLLTRLVFPEEMGLYTGLSSGITSLAGPAAAIISGIVVGTLEQPHFDRLFPFCAGIFVASLIPLALLSVKKSRLARARAEQMKGAAGAVPAA